MRGGSDPHTNEAVESGKTSTQPRAANAGYISDSEVWEELVRRLGGPYAVIEQLTVVLENDAKDNFPAVGPDTGGFCYLRLFDPVEHRDASRLGAYPTVAAVRSFSNGRSDPFGLRTVAVEVRRVTGRRVAHVQHRGGDSGLRPVEALAALSKDCCVGGIPDGPSSEFPPGWIPAKLVAYQCWDFTMGPSKRAMDFLGWVGELRDDYCLVSHESSRLRWVVSTSPVGPETSNIDIIPPNGKTMSLKRWESTVAHTRFHQDWAVRGDKVFVEVYVWRAAKFTTTPGAPAPTPKPGEGGHHELSTSSGRSVHALANGNGRLYREGYCYQNAINGNLGDFTEVLGARPSVAAILCVLADAKTREGFKGCVFESGHDLIATGSGLYHVVNGNLTGVEFLEKMCSLPRGSTVGATQAEAILPSRHENISDAAQLAIRPKQAGVLMHIPFAAKLTPESPVLFWDLTAGKKLGGLVSHFESAELVSLSVKATVHKGDGDTIFHLAADTVTEPFKADMDWVGAPHTLHVSGNSQGATTGEMVLSGNHGFGNQLKGVPVGNPTPVIQGWLETTVVANVLLKAVLSVRVTGTGNPRAIVLLARKATGAMINTMDDDDSDDDEPVTAGPSNKHQGR